MKRRTFNEEAKLRIANIVQGALAIVPFEERVSIGFERIGQGAFTDVNIGAVNRSPATIIVNIDWYESTTADDVKYILRHETRHLYQRSQVEKMQNGQQLSENVETVNQWAYEFKHYISNTPATELQHFRQACEIDAYVFASFISAVETVDDEGCSVPEIDYPGIGEQVRDSVVNIIQSTPYETLLQYRDYFKGQQV